MTPLTIDVLNREKPVIRSRVINFMNMIGMPLDQLSRACSRWAWETRWRLEEIGYTDFVIQGGTMKICVNNTSEVDPSEGWYVGYEADLPDSTYDEFHVWVVYQKRHLIDLTAGYFEQNMKAMCALQTSENYCWNRKPFPDTLYIRHADEKKLKAHGIIYRCTPEMNMRLNANPRVNPYLN